MLQEKQIEKSLKIILKFISRKKFYRQKVRKKIFITIDKEKKELPKNSDFIINNNYKIEHSISKLKTFLNKINKKNTIS